MIRIALRRWFPVVFFTALYLAYLGMLFGFADIRDPGHLLYSFARIAAPAIELAAFYLLSRYLLRQWQATCHVRWWLLYVVVGVVVCLVYLVQVYSLYLSNNFVSVLALQNLHYSSFGTSVWAILAVLFAIVWIMLFAATAWSRPLEAASIGDAQLVAVGRWRVGISVVLVLVCYFLLFTQQRRRVMLEPDFRQVPIASLAVNVAVALRGDHLSTDASIPIAGNSSCFSAPTTEEVPGYPFQKSAVYANPLPVGKKAAAVSTPNVIVFFTEGTSTRLIGAYGGKYPGLTPNIDRLAGKSMKVINYFNHTAATFRGIIGQTSSGFPYAGGEGESGWKSGNNENKLASIERQTLPLIFDQRGYGTYFFEPEYDGSPFTEMIRALGFRKLYDFEKISALLHGKVNIQDKTKQLDDGTLFRGLVAFLKKRTADKNTEPFFAGTYNIGTHAFIPVVTGGLRYGDGKSEVLNKLHNYDGAIGNFLDYFYSSPYAKDTILIFTSDHATYPDKPYREVAGSSIKPFFVDDIPLLIYDPTHRLPFVLDAQGRNSLDMAPTLLQLLGIEDVPNSFLGRSLFERSSFTVGISALGGDYYVTTPAGVNASWEVSDSLKKTVACEVGVVNSYYGLERQNRLFKSAAR